MLFSLFKLIPQAKFNFDKKKEEEKGREVNLSKVFFI